MIEVTFEIEIDRSGAPETPLLDGYDLSMLLDHTKDQINRHIQQSLDSLWCEEHHKQARVCVAGTYSMDTEQLDISYHVDTCCKQFLLKAVAALNRS